MNVFRTVAALYVEPTGVYADEFEVDPWDEARDARQYAGPHPVVAHPPCQRWGKFWHGSTRKPHQFKMGDGVWSCCVYQGHYGHIAGKATWLLASRVALPELKWGKTPQRLHPRAVELHGYEKARRIGMVAMIGGKDKTSIRNGTPPEFRDVLLSIARSAS